MATSSIPLRRLSSSKYTPSDYTSIAETASTTATLLPAGKPFLPTTSLQIQAPGKSPISFPLPLKHLTIPIFSPATSRPVYISIRETRRSGTCSLVDAEDESETSIARTTYWFGPGRNPQVRIGRDDDVGAVVFEMVGKSLFSRTVGFESGRLGRFEWRYAGKRERRAVGGRVEVNNLLVLEKIVGGDRVTVAQLVRGEETRTAGTKASYAGNGGKLEMCLNSENGEVLVDEVTVVVTCLVMLKKEVDRMRGWQAAVITSGGGGS